MDVCGYSFVIMVKGMASFVNQLILENLGSFEKKRSCDMDGYGVYGKTVKRKLYESDEKERYLHIFFGSSHVCTKICKVIDILRLMVYTMYIPSEVKL